MAKSYRQSDTQAACASIGRLAVEGGSAGSVAVSRSLPSGASPVVQLFFEFVPGSGVSWAGGNWTIRMNVTTANMTGTVYGVRIRRVNSACVLQETLYDDGGTATTQSLGSTGVLTWNLTGVAAATSPAATDKIAVDLYILASMTIQSFSFTPTELIDTPFGIAGTTYTMSVSGSVSSSGGIGKLLNRPFTAAVVSSAGILRRTMKDTLVGAVTSIVGGMVRSTSRRVNRMRMNIAPYSEQLEQWVSAWSNSTIGAVAADRIATYIARITATTNSVAAPDNATTADTMLETAVTGDHTSGCNIRKKYAPTGTRCVWSKYMQSGLGRDWGHLNVYDGGDGGWYYAYFDLTNGVVGTKDANIESSGIRRVAGTNWYRCWISYITHADAGNDPFHYFEQGIASADGTKSYLGDVTKGLYVWGAMLEVNAEVTEPSDYLATTTSIPPTTTWVHVRNVSTLTGGKVALLSLTGAVTSIVGGLARQTFKGLAGLVTSIVGVITARRTATSRTSGTVASSGTLSRLTNKFFTGGVTSAGVIAKSKIALKTVTGAVTSIVGSIVRRANVVKSGSVSSSGALASAKQAVRAFTGAVTSIMGGLVRQARKPFTGGVASSGALSKLYQAGTKFVGDAIVMPVGSLGRKTSKFFSGGVRSVVGGLIRQAQVRTAGNVGSGGAVSRRAGKLTSGSAGIAGEIVRRANVIRSGLVGSSGLLSRVTPRAFTGGVPSVGSMARSARRAVDGFAVSVGTMIRSARRSLTGLLSSSGSLGVSRLFARLLTGSVGSTGTLFKQSIKARFFTAVVTPVGTLGRKTSKFFTANVPSAGTIVRRANKAFTAAVGSIGTLIHLPQRFFSGLVASSATLVRQTRVRMGGNVPSVGDLARRSFRSLEGAVPILGTLVRTMRREFVGVVGSAGAITRSYLREFSGTVASSGVLTVATYTLRVLRGVFLSGMRFVGTYLSQHRFFGERLSEHRTRGER